jgi:hypothetical protein
MKASRKYAALAGIISILLVFGFVFTACPQDSGSGDSDTEKAKDTDAKDKEDEDDNPFIGDWVGANKESEDYTLTVTAAKWTLKEGKTKAAEGTYTYSGKKAAVTLSGLLYWDDDEKDYVWGTPEEAGLSSSEKKGTATLSGTTLTLEVIDEEWEFEKD